MAKDHEAAVAVVQAKLVKTLQYIPLLLVLVQAVMVFGVQLQDQMLLMPVVVIRDILVQVLLGDLADMVAEVVMVRQRKMALLSSDTAQMLQHL
jgi:hypothetical protein